MSATGQHGDEQIGSTEQLAAERKNFDERDADDRDDSGQPQ
jgi:hypothetical protein